MTHEVDLGRRGESPPASNAYGTIEDEGEGQVIISALFREHDSAAAAIRELRDIGIPAESISVIARDERSSSRAGAVGVTDVPREEVMEDGITHRVSSELPNDEELATTATGMTGRDPASLIDARYASSGAPPDGGERQSLSQESDMIRRTEAEAAADEDIYTDFPAEPGGINPESPAASGAGSDVQSAARGHANPAGSAAVGAGIGSVLGLLAGLVGLAIPGVGPFIAAGPLAAVLSTTIAGGVAGGVIGALSSIGVPEEYAREYASAIEAGQTLVSVRADALSRDHVERVLVANGGESVG